MSHYLLVTSVK